VFSDWFVVPFSRYSYNKRVICNSPRVTYVSETKQSYLITTHISDEAFYWRACGEIVLSVVFYFTLMKNKLWFTECVGCVLFII